MARGKIKLEFIRNMNTRRSTLKKRALVISKKAAELQILCDVVVAFALLDVNGEPEAFPSYEAARDMMAHAMGTPLAERSQKASTQEGFLSERIAKESSKLQSLAEKNNRFEGTELLGKTFEGSVNIDMINDQMSLLCMNRVIVEKFRDIEMRNRQPHVDDNKNVVSNPQLQYFMDDGTGIGNAIPYNQSQFVVDANGNFNPYPSPQFVINENNKTEFVPPTQPHPGGVNSVIINSNNDIDDLPAWYFQSTPLNQGLLARPRIQKGNSNGAGPSRSYSNSRG